MFFNNIFCTNNSNTSVDRMNYRKLLVYDRTMMTEPWLNLLAKSHVATFVLTPPLSSFFFQPRIQIHFERKQAK